MVNNEKSLNLLVANKLIKFSNFSSIKEQTELCLFLIISSKALNSLVYEDLAIDILNNLVKNIFQNTIVTNTPNDSACFIIIIKLISKSLSLKLEINVLNKHFEKNILRKCSISVKVAYLSSFMRKKNKYILDNLLKKLNSSIDNSSLSFFELYLLSSILVFQKLDFRDQLLKIIRLEMKKLKESEDEYSLETWRIITVLLDKSKWINKFNKIKNERKLWETRCEDSNLAHEIELIRFADPYLFYSQKLISLL